MCCKVMSILSDLSKKQAPTSSDIGQDGFDFSRTEVTEAVEIFGERGELVEITVFFV